MSQSIAPHPPHLDFREDWLLGDPAGLCDEADLDALSFEPLEVEELGIRDARVDGCRFLGLVSEAVDATGAVLRDALFARPEIAVLKAARGRWTDLVHEDGRLGVLEAYGSVWTRVAFRRMKLFYLNLRGCEIVDLMLVGCDIDELDLGDATVRRVSLLDSRVNTLTVHGAKLEAVDLRGGSYSKIVGISNLKGTIIDHELLGELAPLLAASIGITLE